MNEHPVSTSLAAILLFCTAVGILVSLLKFGGGEPVGALMVLGSLGLVAKWGL